MSSKSNVSTLAAFTALVAATGLVTAIPAEAGQVAGAGPPEAVVGLPDTGHAPGEVATVTIFGAQSATHTARLRQISLGRPAISNAASSGLSTD